jgi:hypothetical protein
MEMLGNVSDVILDCVHKLKGKDPQGNQPICSILRKTAACVAAIEQELKSTLPTVSKKKGNNSYVANRRRVFESQNAVQTMSSTDSNSSYSAIDKYLEKKDTVGKENVPPPNPAKRAKVMHPVKTVNTLPQPANGSQYSPAEACNILAAIKDSKERPAVARKMHDEGLIPCGERAMIHRVNLFIKTGVLPRPWGVTGRRPLVPMNDLEILQKPAFERNGQSFGKTELEKNIIKYRNEEWEKRGLSTVGLPDKVHPRTLNNYHDLVVADPALAITSSSISKSEARIIAENSIRSTMSYVITGSIALFLFGKAPSTWRVPPLKDATEGAQLMNKLVSKANNDAPVYAVHPDMNFNIDDSGEWAITGTKRAADAYMVVAVADHETTSCRSNYHYSSKEDDLDIPDGLRTRLTAISSASGLQAPFVVTVARSRSTFREAKSLAT